MVIGSTLEATGDIASPIVDFYIKAIEDATNMVDSIESIYAIKNEDAPSPLNAARAYNTKLKHRMLDGVSHLVNHKALEEKVERKTFFNSKVLQKLNGDAQSMAHMFRAMGLSEKAIEKSLLTLSDVQENEKSGKKEIWIDENNKISLSDNEFESIDSITFSDDFITEADKSGSKAAELLQFIVFDSAMLSKIEYQEKKNELFQLIKDDPNIAAAIKAEAKFSTFDQNGFNDFLEGMRDMVLAGVAEEKRNRHEAKLAAKNLYVMWTDEDQEVYEHSPTFNLQSIHTNQMEDKTLMLGARPSTKENEEMYFQAWKVNSERKLQRYQTKYDTLVEMDVANRGGNYQQELDETKKLLDRYKIWANDPDKAIEYWESKTNIQNMKEAIQNEFKYHRTARDVEALNKPKGLGNMWWSYLVNSQAPNDGRGESDIQTFLTVNNNEAMECLTKLAAFTLEQFKNNGAFPIFEQVGHYDELTGKTIVENVFVDHLQDYLSKKDNRKFFEDKYGYVFDYDGKDPETASLRDVMQVLRKAGIDFFEHRNSSRYYQIGNGDSLAYAFDQIEFIMSGLKLGWFDLMKDIDVEKNGFGEPSQYVVDTEGNLVAPSKTTKIVGISEDGEFIPKILNKKITKQDLQELQEKSEEMKQQADKVRERASSLKAQISSYGGEDKIDEKIEEKKEEINQKLEKIKTFQKERGIIGREQVESKVEEISSLERKKEILSDLKKERKQVRAGLEQILKEMESPIIPHVTVTYERNQRKFELEEKLEKVQEQIKLQKKDIKQENKKEEKREKRQEVLGQKIEAVSLEIKLAEKDIEKLQGLNLGEVKKLEDRAKKLDEFSDKLTISKGDTVVEYINLKTGEELPHIRRYSVRNKDVAHSIMGEIAASHYNGGNAGAMFYDVRHKLNLVYEENPREPFHQKTGILDNEGTRKYSDNPEGFREELAPENWKRAINYATLRDQTRNQTMNEVGPQLGPHVMRMVDNIQNMFGEDFGKFMGKVASEAISQGVGLAAKGVGEAIAGSSGNKRQTKLEKKFLKEYSSLKEEAMNLAQDIKDNRMKLHILEDTHGDNISVVQDKVDKLNEEFEGLKEKERILKEEKKPALEEKIANSSVSKTKMDRLADAVLAGKSINDLIKKPNKVGNIVFTILRGGKNTLNGIRNLAGTALSPLAGGYNAVVYSAELVTGKDLSDKKLPYTGWKSLALSAAFYLGAMNVGGYRSAAVQAVQDFMPTDTKEVTVNGETKKEIDGKFNVHDIQANDNIINEINSRSVKSDNIQNPFGSDPITLEAGTNYNIGGVVVTPINDINITLSSEDSLTIATDKDGKQFYQKIEIPSGELKIDGKKYTIDELKEYSQSVNPRLGDIYKIPDTQLKEMIDIHNAKQQNLQSQVG